MINWCEVDITIEPYIEFLEGTLSFGPDGCSFGRLATGAWNEPPQVHSPPPTATPMEHPPTVIRFPESSISSVRIRSDGCEAYAADGPRAVCQQFFTGKLQLLDLTRGTSRTVGETSSTIHDIRLDGQSVVWLEGTYEQTPDSIPCRSGGTLSWALVRFDLETRDTTVVDQGTQTRNEHCGPEWPAFDLDGTSLALATEATNGGWEVKLFPIDRGDAVRTISTDLAIESVALSGGEIAFVEGVVEGARLNLDRWTVFASTRLLISTPDSTTPMPVTTDAYSVQMNAGRMVWMEGQDYNVSQSYGRLLTATSDDFQAVALADIAYPDYAVGDGFVAWTHGLNLWNSSNGLSAQVDWTEDNGGVHEQNLSDGWLTWVGFKTYGDGERMFGLPVEDIPL
jgi:hypothetical protein